MRFVDSITTPRANLSPDGFCREWDDAETRAALIRSGQTCAEYLCGTTPPVKVYLDRDVYVGSEPPSRETIEEETRRVTTKTQELIDRLTVPDVGDLTFVLATRHGYCAGRASHKLSFRPFIQGMSIRYTDIPKVIAWAGQEDFWDMSVYKAREQLLATINGCKGRLGGVLDDRVLRMAAPGDDVLRYVVQHVEADWPLLDLPVTYQSESPAPVDRLPRRAAASVDFVRGMVSCLSARTADDRRKWIAVGVALKSDPNGDQYFRDWVTFSMKGKKFKGEGECARTWAGLRSEQCPTAGPSCGLGTLLFHAKSDDRARYARIVGRQQPRASVVPGPRVGRTPKTYRMTSDI